jgi:ribosome-binding protein aMBF1 (putative translation factor)
LATGSLGVTAREMNGKGVHRVSTPATTVPGAQLRAEREGAGLSLTEMARMIKFSKSLLGMVETGQRTPSVALIEAYERVLDQLGP